MKKEESNRPRNLRGDALPAEGHSVAVDGKIKSTYKTPEEAFAAGLEIKKKYPVVQVCVYDAGTGIRTLVESPAGGAET